LVVAAIGVVDVDIGKPREFERRLRPPKAANERKSTSEAQKIGSDRSPDSADASKPRSFRRSVRHLHPYYCLVLLAVPAAIVEPLKMTGLVETGRGHWLVGSAILAAAYLLSFLLLNRLFRIVRPRLLTLPWFRHSRRKVLGFRRRCLAHVFQYDGGLKAKASAEMVSRKSLRNDQLLLWHRGASRRAEQKPRRVTALPGFYTGA
jgi:hypothetical protein